MNTVLVRTNWTKLIGWAFGPLLILLAAWAVFSDLSVREVLTWDNLSRSTGLTRNPMIGIACFVLYVAIAVRLTVGQISNGGLYVWFEGPKLKWINKEVGTVSSIDAESIALTTKFGSPALEFQLTDGTRRSIPLGVAEYSDDLPERLAEIVLANRDSVGSKPQLP